MAGHSPKPPTSDGLPAGSWLQRNGVYLLAVGLAVAAWSAFLVDLPLARFAATRSLPRELSKLFALSEVFSHGLGVLLIVVAVAVLDRTSWRKLPRLLATSFGTGILANLVKATVARSRPNAADLQAGVLDAFHGWLPILWPADATPAWNRSLQSFPSGHTATAVGLALGLSWLYPRGRWLFCGLACLAACQRIDSGAHYLSDTLAAAALACLWAGVCLDRRAIGRLFDRWEARSPQTGSLERPNIRSADEPTT